MASAMTTATCRERSRSEASPPQSEATHGSQSRLSRQRLERLGPEAPTDEQLITFIRRGRQGAFDILATRYQARLLRFCRQILRSREDAEDALQDVLTSAFNAIVADDRDIQVRAWLYRIARNRCINQLRRATPVAAGSMDDRHAERTLIEEVAGRQRLRQLVSDVQTLPDTQRIALLLREVDGFSYQQIALAMGKTVPAVKSLLVRARSNLLNSATARDAMRTASGDGRSVARRRATARGNPRTVSYRRARAAAMGTSRTPRTGTPAHAPQ